MKLKTEELRKFLTAAAQIRPNPTAMHLDSIKIECIGQDVFFIKTNNNIWCKYNYVGQAQAPETFIVNERMLNGIAVTTREYEIELSLSPDGNTLQIIDGADILETKQQDVVLFPAIKEATGEKVKITKEAVDRIRIASKYISTAANKTALNFVQIGAKGIFAFNGSVLYYHDTKELPEVFFDEEPLNIIKGNDDIFYWTSESYDFFQIEGFIYGFIKSVVPPIDFMPIVKQAGKGGFVINNQDFLDFCTRVQYSKRKEGPIGSFIGIDNETLNLKFIDPAFNININRNSAIVSNGGVDEFSFSVEHVQMMLKTLPYESLTFTKLGNGHYGVSSIDDPGYKGIIARLQDKTEGTK